MTTTTKVRRNTRAAFTAGFAGAVLAASIAAPAAAVVVYAKEKNHSDSYTGAIYHRVKGGSIIAPAIVAEPGELRRVAVNSDWPQAVGVKVWQPANTRLKVYSLGIRIHNYGCVDHGRDVWVKKGPVYDGRFTTKILRGC